MSGIGPGCVSTWFTMTSTNWPRFSPSGRARLPARSAPSSEPAAGHNNLQPAKTWRSQRCARRKGKLAPPALSPSNLNPPAAGGVLSWSSRQVGFHKSQPGDRPASCAQDQAKGYPFLPLDRFWATAARMRSCRAVSLTASPSWRSMARVALASRPALNRPAGSLSEAPLKKLSFT